MVSSVPAGKSWQVTSQTHTTGLDNTGAAGPGWSVQFQTAKGDTGKVFIPEAQYSADAVRARIQPIVDTMNAVAEMSG